MHKSVFTLVELFETDKKDNVSSEEKANIVFELFYKKNHRQWFEPEIHLAIERIWVASKMGDEYWKRVFTIFEFSA